MSNTAKQARCRLLTLSSKIKIPHVNDTITIKQLHRPILIAKPALRMLKTTAVPPGTQNMPDTIPHGVKEYFTPNKSTIQQSKKHMVLLYVCMANGSMFTLLALSDLIGTPNDPKQNSAMIAAINPQASEQLFNTI
jgi:hypothetical protein